MALELPTTLSPSKVSSFQSCPLSFRFSAIDRLPQEPGVAASKGTLVHAALERLFFLRSEDRTPENGQKCLDEAFEIYAQEYDYYGLELDEKAAEGFYKDAQKLMVKYFKLEDPREVVPVGIELQCEAYIGDIRLRGIIDRLELDEDGGLIVTDYKTGRTPPPQFEQARLGGIHFYAYMVEQFFGVRPAKVQLLYIGEPKAIIATPTEQTIRGQGKKLKAIWQSIERACEKEDFRPKKSKLCDWCDYQAFCPEFGGSIEDGVALGLSLRGK